MQILDATSQLVIFGLEFSMCWFVWGFQGIKIIPELMTPELKQSKQTTFTLHIRV